MTLIMLGIALTMWISLASADEEIELYVRTDRASYGYGEEGTLFVTVWNKGGAVDLKNIKANFPWEGFYHETWDGNATLELEGSIGNGEKKTYEIPFNVPSESRDVWTDNKADVTLNYEADLIHGDEERSVEIKVAATVYNENLTPIYYLTAVLTTAVIIAIIELYFVWKRLGRLTSTPPTA